jgi:hypothetical protein
MAIGDMKQGGELLNVTGQTGVLDPGWFAVQQDDRSQIAFVFSLIAGTATYVLEGRNSPNDVGIQLATGSASAKALVEKFAQFKCRLSAASGAQCVGSITVGSMRQAS